MSKFETNLFFLDEDPIRAAQHLCDSHVITIPIRAAVLSSRILNKKGFQTSWLELSELSLATQAWAQENASNLSWVIQHGLAAVDEYLRRYPGQSERSSETLRACRELCLLPPWRDHTPFPQAFSEIYKSKDPVQGNRKYYRSEDSWVASWDRLGNHPTWWLSANDF